MSDERPPPDDWLTEDPFADAEDPAARERAERRAEREQKRRERAAKRAGEPPPPPAEAPPAEPAKPKRTPEQEFWDEEPTPEPAPPAAAATGAAANARNGEEGTSGSEPPAPGEKLRRRFRRRKSEAEPETSAGRPTPPASGSEASALPGSVPPAERSAAPSSGPEGSVVTPSDPERSAAPSSEPEGSAATPSESERAAAERTRPAGNARRAEGPPPKPESPRQEPDRAAAERERPADAKAATGPSKPAPDLGPPTELQPLPPAPPPQGQPSGPATEDHALEPLPVGADPTRPATGEQLVPDPQAPGVRGQTSEEWAAVPAARADALDEELHEEGNPEMAGAARTGRRSGDGGRRGGGGFLGALARHPFRIAAVVILIVVLWFLNGLFEPFHGDGHGKVAVRIPKGASVSEVGDILEKRGVIGGPGLIDASTLFQIRVTLAGKRSDLYAGKFTLQKDMSYGAAIDALSQEPSAQKPGVTTVTIPEGYSRPQAAQLVKEDGVPGKYMQATVKSKVLSPAEYGGKQAQNLEGFLFPNTFELKPNAPVKKLVALQLEDFKKKIKQVNMKYAKSKNLTVYDVVTIASMIEDEAGVAKQRKLVGSVIYNRLREGIPLGIDATIRFATGNYTRPLTVSELETDSPYNTRLNQGLPPGPINSPGLAALRAAAHPKETDFIYYVNDPDSCNELTFAKTEAEFEAAVQKYEDAREANGGNAPSTCGE